MKILKLKHKFAYTAGIVFGLFFLASIIRIENVKSSTLTHIDAYMQAVRNYLYDNIVIGDCDFRCSVDSYVEDFPDVTWHRCVVMLENLHTKERHSMSINYIANACNFEIHTDSNCNNIYTSPKVVFGQMPHGLLSIVQSWINAYLGKVRE